MWESIPRVLYEVPFHGFSTFDRNQLAKIRQHGFKEQLTKSEDVKFEPDLLKTNEEIAPQSLRILQMFLSEGLVQAPTVEQLRRIDISSNINLLSVPFELYLFLSLRSHLRRNVQYSAIDNCQKHERV